MVNEVNLISYPIWEMEYEEGPVRWSFLIYNNFHFYTTSFYF